MSIIWIILKYDIRFFSKSVIFKNFKCGYYFANLQLSLTNLTGFKTGMMSLSLVSLLQGQKF